MLDFVIGRAIIGDPKLASREIDGMVTSTSSQFLFHKKFLHQLVNKPEYKWQNEQQFLFVAIDPASGSDHSAFSILTLGYENGNYAIAGLDGDHSSDPRVINAMLVDHVVGLRSKPQYANAHLIVIVESNMSFITAAQIEQLLTIPSLAPMEFLSYDKKGRTGVWTDDKYKEVYAKTLQDTLGDNLLSFANPFVSKNGKQMKDELIKQMKVFRKDVKAPADVVHGKSKISYSGKGPGRPDDYCMVLMMALYHLRDKRRDATFMEIAERNNWRI